MPRTGGEGGGSYRSVESRSFAPTPAPKPVSQPVKVNPVATARDTINQQTQALKNRDVELTKKLEDEKNKYQAAKKPVYEAMDKAASGFEARRQNLLTDAKNAGQRTDKTYETFTTKMEKFANDAEKEAQNAMTLEQLADPANSAAFKNTRGLFETEAQGENTQGLANFGVLSALGGQSANASMQGLGPLTAGQQAAMFAGSQRQAGEAFANTQRRMQALRDQGLTQGLAAHQNQYEAGQGAKRMFAGAVDQRLGMEKDWAALGERNRGEQAGLQSDITGSQMGTQQRRLSGAQEDYGLNTGLNRDITQRQAGLSQMQIGQANADIGTQMTQQQIEQQRQAAADAAEAQQKAAMFQMAGTLGGAAIGAFGGPAGSAIGGALGGAAGAGQGGGSYTAQQPAGQGYNLGLQPSTYNAGGYQGNYYLSNRMR